MSNPTKILIFVIAITTLFFLPLSALAEVNPGSLVKGSRAEIFLISEEGELRWIPDETTFKALGYNWSEVVEITDQELLEYPFGENLIAVETKQVIPTAVEIEAKVREVFADAPIMIPIAKCESGFLQFRQDGSLVRSPNGLYIGIFQIDESIHTEYALSLGMDIKTIDGNLAYARHLYDRKGSQPWPACALRSAPIKDNLKLGDENSTVKTLQEILNQAGYTIANSGPGSAGNETEYFGSLTREALRRFQCDKGIICSGDESTTGYGLVGPRTRTALTSYY